MIRYKVTVTLEDGSSLAFDDASFTVSGDGILQVSVSARAVYCWANGYWTAVAMVAQDG